MHFKIVALLLAATALAHKSTCPGSGRCCRCLTNRRYNNGQTQCVYDRVGAKDWGDDGHGLYFCKMTASQDKIAEYCRGEAGHCHLDSAITYGMGSYDCWDCEKEEGAGNGCTQ